MPVTLSCLNAPASLGFDEIIDARAPAEYAEDHIPGAINLPVMDNHERARIGTIYKQDSPFQARKQGAAILARNVAAHLDTTLATRPKGYRPLLYCWRGGQRSGAFALILRQIGWQAETIEGGYRSWRGLVHKALYKTPWPTPLVVLDGNTGTAKTALLARLRAQGTQTIDLEALANHRGSIFGAMTGGQPAQKGFETRLAAAMTALDPTRPVVIEGESAKIGAISLPSTLWQAMINAPRIFLSVPLPVRAAFLSHTYGDIIADPDRLQAHIRALAPMHARARIEQWRDLIAAGHFSTLAAELMAHHYDPRYARHRARFDHIRQAAITLQSLDDTALDQAARQIAEQAVRLSTG